MLRPVDTQTIYQQTPQVSNKQQAFLHGEEMQQAQFAQISHKELEAKQQSVNEVCKDEKADHDLKKDQKRRNSETPKKYKKKKSDTKEESKDKSMTHIDIRI